MFTVLLLLKSEGDFNANQPSAGFEFIKTCILLQGGVKLPGDNA